MKNNLFPPVARSADPSNLGGITLRNPFIAAGNEIFPPLPVSAGNARLDGIGASKHVLKIAGYQEMTAANCDRFRKAACAAWNDHTDVEIDLSKTTFIDCAGLGALIAVRNLTRERKGVARLMNPTSPVQQMLDLTRTGQLFDIVNAEDDLLFSPAAHN